jgi:hypothetical protein
VALQRRTTLTGALTLTVAIRAPSATAAVTATTAARTDERRTRATGATSTRARVAVEIDRPYPPSQGDVVLKTALHRWLVPWMVAAAAPACVLEIEDGDDAVYGYGSGILTAEWTVDGWTDSEACYDFGARDFEFIVYGRRSFDTVVTARCDEFVLSIDVPEGRFSIDATLIDRYGDPVTTTLALDDVDVYDGEEVVIPIDFPPDALL